MGKHSNITKAASLMLVAVLLSRLLGLVREIIMAKQFGQGGDVSAYTAAFNLPDLLYFFLSSGALSSAFIPVFTEYFNNGRQKEAWQIFSIISSLMGIILTIIIVVAWFFATPLVTLFAVPGFAAKNPDLVPLTVILTKIILPCQLFFFMGGIMMGTLEARNKFNARAAGPVIYNLGIIGGALILGHWIGIKGLAVGTLIGAFAGNIVYTYYCLKKEGFEYKFSLNIKNEGVIKVGLLALPVIFGLSLPQIDIIVNKWFASWISESAPAAINYANRLMQLPLGIFAQAAGTAILPALSIYAAEKAFDKMRSAVAYGVRTIMLENIPATAFMVLMADPIVRSVFMHGKFTSADVPLTAYILMFYSLGIFAWAGQAIVARGFFAIQDTVTPVIIGTVSTIIFIPLNFILLKFLNSGGLALATTITISIHFFTLLIFLRKKLGGIGGSSILRSLKKIMVGTLVMVIVCIGVRYVCSNMLGTYKLQIEDIKNPEELAYIITNSNAEESKSIKPYLSMKTKINARQHEEYKIVKKSLDKNLIDHINNLIKSNAFEKNSNIQNRKTIDEIFPSSLRGFKDRTSFISRIILGQNMANNMVSSPDGLYETKDIISTEKLLVDINNGKSEIEIKIRENMPNNLRNRINIFNILSKDVTALPAEIRTDLNTFIAENNPDNLKSNKEKINREQLASIYPKYVINKPFLRVESRTRSIITVLIGMMFCVLSYYAVLKKLKVDDLDDIVNSLLRRKSK